MWWNSNQTVINGQWKSDSKQDEPEKKVSKEKQHKSQWRAEG